MFGYIHSYRSEPEAANGGDASDVPVSSSEHHPSVGTLKSQPAEPNNMLGSPASSTHSSPSKVRTHMLIYNTIRELYLNHLALSEQLVQRRTNLPILTL